MPNLVVIHEIMNGIVVIRIQAEMHENRNLRIIRQYLDQHQLLDSKHAFKGYIVDFENVHYINSMGIGFLMDCFKECKNSDRSLVFCNMSKGLKLTFQRLHLDEVVMIYDSREEAEQFFSMTWLH